MIWTHILDFICPPACPMCRAFLRAPNQICPECFKELDFITRPQCAVCGLPFEFDIWEGSLCGACLRKKPRYDVARACLVYDEASKKLILPFKHGDRMELVPLLVRLLEQTGGDLIRRADAVMPVPLHRLRLMKRKYNQAALLAQKLARGHRKRYLPHTLVRIRHTPIQGHLPPNQRRKNVARAFAVKCPDQIRGKNILLIDDVMTSGATADECARVLKRAGARRVMILTLARVCRG
ncbi:MAG: ComF family protein [Alphaproteobacteria bacterium]|nr:ComF family protein [Alphaproteobacteria bacterium]